MRILIAASLAAFVPLAAMADDTPPPADGMKLSEIVAALEASVGDKLAYIDEIEWDDGRWEVEYYTTDKQEVEVNLDARTGQPIN